MKTSSKLILGTVQMGIPYGIQQGGNLPFDQSKNILKKAFDSGIEILDTAEVYGKAHQVIGKFHKIYPGKTFKVITKLPKVLKGEIYFKLKQYLKELGINQLEAIMFHSFDTFQNNTGVLKELQELKREGMFKYIGISIYSNEQMLEVIQNKNIDLIQLPFNLLDNFSLRGDLLKLAKKNGKTVHARSAFLQGLFFMDCESKNEVVQKMRPQLVELNKIASIEKRSMASLALNYSIQQKNIDKVLIGVDSVNQLNQNLSILGETISEMSMEKINNVRVPDFNLLNPSLW